MTKVMTLIGFAAVIVALFAAATPAYAEFESKSKESDKGSSELFETVFEAGGAVVACTAFGEAASKGSWTVEKGEKEVLKSPDLLLKVTSWGKCEVTKPIKGTVKITGCELEVEQSGEQMNLTGRLVKSCALEGPVGCTVTASSASNKLLKLFEIYKSGESGESTVFQPDVSNLTTEVTSACTLAGIKATSEGKMFGVWEAQQGQANGVREFAIDAPASINASGNFMVKVKRIGGVAGTLPPGRIAVLQSETAAAGQFTANAGEIATCRTTFNYALNGAACDFETTYNKAMGLGYALIGVEGGANGMVRSARIVHGD